MTTATQTVKERPILFSGEMVRAILDGQKTQTRRVIKHDFDDPGGFPCPYGKPGDRLWVRETWNHYDIWTPGPEGYGKAVYRATDEPGKEVGWRPSIFMPRWASRITLEITNVRVERLQDISEADAEVEGFLDEDHSLCERYGLDSSWTSCRDLFRLTWDRINGKKHPWLSNPWVWVVEFKKI